MKLPFSLIFAGLLTGCSALPQSCITAQTASLKVTRADGSVVVERPAETVEFCPPRVGVGP